MNNGIWELISASLVKCVVMAALKNAVVHCILKRFALDPIILDTFSLYFQFCLLGNLVGNIVGQG